MARKVTTDGLIPIGNFNKGGLAFSKWSGPVDSVYKMIGFDPHTNPGVIDVEQKMTAETGLNVPNELCKVAVNSSNGAQYWFSSTTGKIWQRDTGGAWTLVYTTSAAAGGSACLGAAEYSGRIWWFTEKRLHYITVANADGADWATDAVPNTATFDIGDSEFHPTQEVNLVLYIGDGNQVAQIDDTTFSSNALDLNSPYRIKCLGTIVTDLLIGTIVEDNVDKTIIARWDTFGDSFTSSDPIPEVGINAFLPADNMVLVQAGLKGNIYYYDGVNLELYNKIPGEFSATATGEVHPNSVAQKEGQIFLAFSNIIGNPADQLIYRIGRHSRSFDYIMDQPYPISERLNGEFVLTGLDLGAILVVGSDIYISWKNGSSYDIDKLDTNNKLDGAYIESRVMYINREEEANFARAIVTYVSLPDNTNINLYLSKNYTAYGAVLDSFTDTNRNIIETKNEAVAFTTIQLKMKVTVSSNNGPRIESAGIFLE